MYYKKFEIPPLRERFSGEWGAINGLPQGWQERQAEEVAAEIERHVGQNFSLDNFENKISKLRKSAEDLRREIVIAFAAFDFGNKMEREKELFSKAESFVFGQRKDKYIRQRLPKGLMTRDLEALRQGTCIPSHLYYESVAHEANSFTDSIEAFINILDQLIRQIEAKSSIVQAVSTESASLQQGIHLVEHICRRFHLIARQIQSRHGHRTTLEITDEYDVQDLLHALLRVFFDDIRPEEWTPSYAGKSARMDFLLKNESIVVEVKKTRQGLGAGEVGTQLIEDIHRYRQHQDCKQLVCFVYDPDSLIANPRGLENDLSREEDGLFVKVLIVPRGE